MLARRVVTRPSTLRSLLQRRFIIPSTSSTTSGLQAPRPNTWLAKIRFRADGKPRSKRIALGFGSLILLNFLLFKTLINTSEEGENVQNHLAKIIYVQYVVTTIYDSVDFDDSISTISYFKKLYQILFSNVRSEEEVDEVFKRMTQMWKGKIMKGSKEPIEVHGRHIMKSAVEKIHRAFRDIKTKSRSYSTITDQISFAQKVMNQAMYDLQRLSLEISISKLPPFES